MVAVDCQLFSVVVDTLFLKTLNFALYRPLTFNYNSTLYSRRRRLHPFNLLSPAAVVVVRINITISINSAFIFIFVVYSSYIYIYKACSFVSASFGVRGLKLS